MIFMDIITLNSRWVEQVLFSSSKHQLFAMEESRMAAWESGLTRMPRQCSPWFHSSSHKDRPLHCKLHMGGRKSSTQRAWEGNGPLTQKNIDNGDETWTPVGPSSIPFAEGWLKPRTLKVEDIQQLTIAFRDAAKRAVDIGFEIIEIHMAHGYLLQSFLSPLANKRTDEYGGSLENRMRFPLEVARAVREVIPMGVPLFVRISAVDWIEGGWEIEDSVQLSRLLKEIGVDVIDCSSGGNLVAGATNSNLKREPGYQAEFARRIKAEVGIQTEAVGLIRTPELAEELLQKKFADLIAIGRQALFNPFWPHQAAEQMGMNQSFVEWPHQYTWWLSKWKSGLVANGESLNNNWRM